MITIAYGSNSLSIAGPELGDTWAQDQSYRNNIIGSGIVVNNQTERPKFKVLDYNLRAMTQTELDALNAILLAARGYKVTLTTPSDGDYSCYVSNIDVEEITLKDSCAYDVRLQFLVPAS